MSDLIYVLWQLFQLVWIFIGLLLGVLILLSGALFVLGTILLNREKRKNRERTPQPW